MLVKLKQIIVPRRGFPEKAVFALREKMRFLPYRKYTFFISNGARRRIKEVPASHTDPPAPYEMYNSNVYISPVVVIIPNRIYLR